MIGLDDARRVCREHADVCLDPACHALANALDGAHYAEALRMVRDVCDPGWRTTEGIPPWSAVSRPEQN